MQRNVKVIVDEDTAEALERHAKAQDRTVSSLIRLAIRTYLNDHRLPKGEK